MKVHVNCALEKGSEVECGSDVSEVKGLIIAQYYTRSGGKGDEDKRYELMAVWDWIKVLSYRRAMKTFPLSSLVTLPRHRPLRKVEKFSG